MCFRPARFRALTSRLAKPGDTITLYGIGFGEVNQGIPPGQIAQGQTSLAAPFDGLNRRYAGDSQLRRAGSNLCRTLPIRRGCAVHWRQQFCACDVYLGRCERNTKALLSHRELTPSLLWRCAFNKVYRNGTRDETPLVVFRLGSSPPGHHLVNRSILLGRIVIDKQLRKLPLTRQPSGDRILDGRKDLVGAEVVTYRERHMGN